MVWRAQDPQGNEAAKIKYEIVPYVRGRGLDLGCGPSKCFPSMLGVDSGKDRELFGIAMRPDREIDDAADLTSFGDASQDFVFSSHLLEHIEDYGAALKEWWRVIRPGGHLVLYLPHKALYPNIGTPGANPDHKHDFVPTDIAKAMSELDPEIQLLVSQTRDAGSEYSFLQVYRKADPQAARPGPQSALEVVDQRPRACVVRYGGFGDMIQAANVLPALKRAGFHVTVMTTPKGRDILREDPHVDAWFLQDDNQVPNGELVDFWAVQAQHYDRFINLSESVEGTLLALPGRANFYWPDAVRRKHLGVNYLEWTAELAGVPYTSEARFYPTDAEERAACERFEIDGGFSIVFALAGSSVHKFWPEQDALIETVLAECPEAHFYLVGDDACKILEVGWEDHPRVHCLSGELSIRETLTLAVLADAVIGPETGVLNAVAFEVMPKVLLLSHSSRENLPKHWLNTTVLAPTFLDGVACYPCHRLHYGSAHCTIDARSGAARCAAVIPAERAIEPLRRAYEAWATD